MIKFNNLSTEEPYQLLKVKYDEAINAGQQNIQALSISSYNTRLEEVESRYVNLKLVKNDEFIFLVIITHQKLFLLKPTIKYLHYYFGLVLMFKLE